MNSMGGKKKPNHNNFILWGDLHSSEYSN